jgi:hypothetical protein
LFLRKIPKQNKLQSILERAENLKIIVGVLNEVAQHEQKQLVQQFTYKDK